MSLTIIGAGIGAAAWMIETRPRAAEVKEEPPVTFVRVLTVARATHQPVIAAMGRVQAEHEVLVQPEVNGRITEQNTALTRGGRLAEGDPLIRIDARDYSAAVAMSEADLAQARLAMREERTLRQVAEHEWRETPRGLSEETLQFALREPHLDAAKARVSSAESRIAKARRDLGKTILRAPFDAVVIDENVDIGQTVGPQSVVARLAGIDRYLVHVALPTAQLKFIDVPEVNVDHGRGSPATVIHTHAGDAAKFEGAVLRLLPAADAGSRMAQLVVGVDDPLDRRRPVAERRMPLLLDTYVRVQVQGRPLADVVELPRTALRDDGSVWIVDGEGRLRSRTVTVSWREPERVLVSEGLSDGERVVITPLPTSTEGTIVEVETPSAASGSASR